VKVDDTGTGLAEGCCFWGRSWSAASSPSTNLVWAGDATQRPAQHSVDFYDRLCALDHKALARVSRLWAPERRSAAGENVLGGLCRSRMFSSTLAGLNPTKLGNVPLLVSEGCRLQDVCRTGRRVVGGVLVCQVAVTCSTPQHTPGLKS